MIFIRTVVGKPYGIAFTFILILLVRTDIAAGLAVGSSHRTFAEIVVSPGGQEKIIAAVFTALGNKSASQSAEKIEIKKSREAVECINVAPYRFASLLYGFTFERHNTGRLDDLPLRCLSIFFVNLCNLIVGQKLSRGMNIFIQEMPISILQMRECIEQINIRFNIAATNEVDELTMTKLRGECIREVKKIHGIFTMEKAMDWQSEYDKFCAVKTKS